MAEFKDKVIIVTGASEGIGRALCLALAPQKPKLVLAARNHERLNELKDELKGQGVESLVVPTDITEKQQCRELIEKTVERFGRLDVLVNNAGMGQWTLLEQIKDPSFYETIMKTNFLGGAYCTYYALPHLKKTKGRLVAVASGLGFFPTPTHTGYCASKHAMIGFYGALRMEIKDSGVSITVIAPGFVATEVHKRSLGPSGEPLGHNPAAAEKYRPVEKEAADIVKAMEKRKRLLLTSPGGGVARVLYPIFPDLIEGIIAKDFVPVNAND